VCRILSHLRHSCMTFEGRVLALAGPLWRSWRELAPRVHGEAEGLETGPKGGGAGPPGALAGPMKVTELSSAVGRQLCACARCERIARIAAAAERAAEAAAKQAAKEAAEEAAQRAEQEARWGVEEATQRAAEEATQRATEEAGRSAKEAAEQPAVSDEADVTEGMLDGWSDWEDRPRAAARSREAPGEEQEAREREEREGEFPTSAGPGKEACPWLEAGWFEKEGITSVMFKNVPCRHTDKNIARILNEGGMAGKYDVIFAPKNPVRKGNLGYFFVNFKSAAFAGECHRTWDAKPFGKSLSDKVCSVQPAKDQGTGYFIEQPAFAFKRRRHRNDTPCPGPVFFT